MYEYENVRGFLFGITPPPNCGFREEVLSSPRRTKAPSYLSVGCPELDHLGKSGNLFQRALLDRHSRYSIKLLQQKRFGATQWQDDN